MNAPHDRRSAYHVVTDDPATSPSPTPFAGPGGDAARTSVAESEQDDAEPPAEIFRPDPKRYVAVGNELSGSRRSAFYPIAPRKEGLQLFFGRSETGAGSTTTAAGSKRPEPQFQCKICGHSFGRIGKLRSHELVHSKEKPFECKVCGRRFRQRGTLVQHERIHYPERAYQCRICMKNLTRWSILETHMLKIHKVQLNGNPPSAEPSSSASTAAQPGENAQSGDGQAILIVSKRKQSGCWRGRRWTVSVHTAGDGVREVIAAWPMRRRRCFANDEQRVRQTEKEREGEPDGE